MVVRGEQYRVSICYSSGWLLYLSLRKSQNLLNYRRQPPPSCLVRAAPSASISAIPINGLCLYLDCDSKVSNIVGREAVLGMNIEMIEKTHGTHRRVNIYGVLWTGSKWQSFTMLNADVSYV